MISTEEQSLILEASSNVIANRSTMGIIAFAGTGKSKTLEMVIEKHPSSMFLYIAFNDAAASDFSGRVANIKNCKVKTINALAYSYIRPGKLRSDYKAYEISSILRCSMTQGRLIQTALKQFLNSDLAEPFEMDLYGKEVIDAVDKIYSMIKTRKILATHSWYLKEFAKRLQSGEIVIDLYDCVLLDEAQDTNPVSLSIFKSFNVGKIFVGDSHQSIYSFRGTIDGLSALEPEYTFNLTKNFRSSDEIIKRANKILSFYKGEVKKIESSNAEGQVVVEAYLSRFNTTLVGKIKELDNFRSIRSLDKIFAPSLAVYYWDAMEDDKIPSEYSFLKEFTCRSQIEDYIAQSGDVEIEAAIRMVEAEKKNNNSILLLYEDAIRKQRKDSRACLSTAHSSKGLEFDKVVIMPDFPDLNLLRPGASASKERVAKYTEEVNLYFVATTRAKYVLRDCTRNAVQIESLKY